MNNYLYNFIRILIFSIILFPFKIYTQTTQLAIKKDAPKVYIDCSGCDLNYLKEKIQFVNFVWDRNEADVHVLISKEKTGSGGKMNTVLFFGKNKFNGVNDTLKFSEESFSSDELNRRNLVHVLKLGLIKYVSKTPIAGKINITFNNKNEKKKKITDEWNFWVYSFNLNSFLNGQESSDFLGLWTSFSANRVVKDLKIKLSLRGNYSESNFKFNDSVIKNITRGYGFYSAIIPAIDDHWSWGIWVTGRSSTFRNIDLGLSVAPGIEYNLFKYNESNNKQFRFAYKLSGNYNKYLEETVYFKTKEYLLEQSIAVSAIFIKQWGTVSATLTERNFMHKFSMNSIELETRIRLNLFKGFRLSITGSYSRIHNQISLARKNATIDEVLLQRRELETQYEYFGSVGISFSFGSIYNNIVNPRFGT